ncbi:MAG: hypothetical protein AB3N28_15545 [Kordiimonas sp.]
MLKLVAASLVSFLFGFGLCVYSAPGYWFDHLGDNTEVIYIGKEYEFVTFGGFIGNNLEADADGFNSYPSIENDLRFVTKSPMFSLSPSDIELVCFSSGVEVAPYFGINIFLVPEAQKRFETGILSAETKEVELTFKGNLVTTVSFLPGAAKNYAAIGTQTYPPGVMNPLNRKEDISLSVHTGDNQVYLLEVARYLSPDSAPKGCHKGFNSTIVEDWEELIKWFW